jgi:cell division protein FtsQ
MSRRESRHHDSADAFSDDVIDPAVEAELAEAFGDPVARDEPDDSVAAESSRNVASGGVTSGETTSGGATSGDDAWGFFRRHLRLGRRRRVRLPRPTFGRLWSKRPSWRVPFRRRRADGDATAVATTTKKSPVTKKVDGRTRVVITDDTAAPAKVSGQARFRERRIAARRAEGRRRLRIAVMVGTVVAVVVVALLLLASPILSIRTIDVEGVVYADPEQVGEIVGSLRGDAILTADLHGAETALEEIPWVREARVSMHLPRRVAIQIDEREPIAFYRAVDGFNRVIDLDGRVLDVIEGDPVDYPPIQGTGPNLSAGEFVGQPFLGSAQLVNALPRELRLRLVSMAVTPEGEVSFLLTDDVTVLFGRPDRFQVKLVALVNEIKRQGSRSYSVIDVSTGEASVR